MSMIGLSRTQDEEVGDGTTSVIVLDLLHLERCFMLQKPSLTIIILQLFAKAYKKSLDDAIAVLDKIAMSIDVKMIVNHQDIAIDATATVGVDLGQGLLGEDINKFI